MHMTYIGSGQQSDPPSVKIDGLEFRLNLARPIPADRHATFEHFRRHPHFRVTDDAPVGTLSAEDQAKLDDLKRREAELAAREAELRKAEIEARKAPVPTPDVFRGTAPGAGAPSGKGAENLRPTPLPGLPGSVPMPPSQKPRE